MHRPVIDRTHPQATFEATPRFLHALQLLVTQGQISRTQAVIVAMHHEFAVKLFGGARLAASIRNPPLLVRRR